MSTKFEFEQPFTFFDFDRKRLKPHWRDIGKLLRKRMKRDLSVKGRSEPGQAPGKQTGTLSKSLKYRVTKTGFSVFIRSEKKKGMDKFYTPFVIYGHVGPNSQMGEKVAKPRLNVFAEEVERYGEREFPDKALKMLEDALKEGVIA